VRQADRGQEMHYSAELKWFAQRDGFQARAGGIYLYVKMPRWDRAGEPASCDDLSRRAHLG